MESVQGGELDNKSEKHCIHGECPFPVHEDFRSERGGGFQELFICHACHRGIHLECLRTTQAVGRQEQEDILDSKVNWRCAKCMENGTFRPSAVMEEFAEIHEWSGNRMAEDSLTPKDHLKTDYTGFQAQLTRRRREQKTSAGPIWQIHTCMQDSSIRC